MLKQARAPLRAPLPAERFVEHDAGEPGRERGGAGEAADRGKGPEITLLDGILGVGAILEYRPGRAEEALIVALHDEAHGKRVALSDPPGQFEVGQGFIAQRDVRHVNGLPHAWLMP